MADDNSNIHQHHHHHHDRSVHVHGNVGNVSTGDGHRGYMVATLVDTQTQEKQQKEIADDLEEWTKGMVATSAFKKVIGMLNKGITWITIKGSPGEGKTTVARMALRELQKSRRQVFQARSPEDFNTAVKTYSRPVILLDDILGDLEFDQAAWLKWKPTFHKLLDVKEHRSHEQETEILKSGHVTVLLVGRDYVLNSASVPMGRLFDFITKPLHVVDMSHSVKRPYQEKKDIWDATIGRSGIDVAEKAIECIFQLEGGHGFPHVCRLFVTIHKSNPDISAIDFFQTPLEFLNTTIKVFLRSPEKCKLFKGMISGNVSERDLQSESSLTETAHELMGSYLRIEHGYFVFDHPSIYDSVAFNLCKYHTLFVIENCKLSFILERIRFDPSRDIYSGSHRDDTGLVMYISESFHRDLAERFANEMSAGNLLPLSHQACTHEVFVKEMMSQLTTPLTELINKKDRCNYYPAERFLCLIASNKSPQLLKYIDNHPDIHLTQSDINTVLYGVCRYAASDVLSYLKQSRHMIDINVKYGNSETPLIVASNTRDSLFVRQILSLKPDINARVQGNKTALHHICRNDVVSAVKQVIDMGADINAKDSGGWSPLHHACGRKHVDVVKLLVKHGADTDTECRDMWGHTLLHVAAMGGSEECVDMFLRAGADVNAQGTDGRTPLHEAALGGSKECVDMLLKAGADVNAQGTDGRTPLHEAAFSRSKECVDMLVKAGADVNVKRTEGCTPLHEAARWRSKECVDMLVKAGADVNAQSTDGRTPLHEAALGGSKECVDMLLNMLKAGADVNVQSTNGYTPLHKAARSRSKGCVDMLLKAGADVNVQSTTGYTPLHEAALGGSKECVDMLLKAGADVNVQSADGHTPLHEAAFSRSKECVDMLLKAGADVNVKRTGLHTTVT